MRRTGIKRGKPLAPGGPLARKGSRPGRGAPIKPVNRKRTAANRKRNFGPEADAVRAKPCLACVAVCAMTGRFTIRQSEAAHVTARGMGAAKGCRFDIVPLCAAHHREAGEAPRASAPKCAWCGKPATCEGQYDSAPHGFACDDCCGHCCEDGHCDPVEPSQRAAFEARYGLDLRREADRIAVGHEPPLGIRGLAARWCAAVEDMRDRATSATCNVGPEPPAEHEIDALMGWVRREMEREVERRCAGQVGADEPSFAWDREALAHRIMQAMGAPFTEDTHGEHGLAWTLCEAAGWPS